MTPIVTYQFPTSIDFGPGACRRLSPFLKEQRIERPIIVTDKGVSQLLWFQELCSVLSGSFSTAIFSNILGNPLKSQADEGKEKARAHQADAVIAVGGGAAMDVAKIIALMTHHPGDIFDYVEAHSQPRPIDQPIPLLIAIPTTAGTGSEVGRSAVISDDHTKIKNIIFSSRLLPRKVFADPELTLDLPPHLTASTGMDALTHVVESYLAKDFHPICDGIALHGLRLISKHLKKCVEFSHLSGNRSPEHLESRGMMLNAAMMGAIAFQKGLGATHSCAHALSTVCDLHHGLANGIVLPYVMEYNLESRPEQFRIMAETVGFTQGEEFISWLVTLKKDIGIPTTLAEVSVTEKHLDDLVLSAVQDSCHQLNPRSVNHENFKRLFLRALGQT